MQGTHIINPADLKRDPAQEGALVDGRLQVLPAEWWQQFSQQEVGVFCVRHGFYCIPTTELVAWLQERIAGRKAIEIGSGSGVLAEAVGIPATDNRMQEWKEIKALYKNIEQTPVTYGSNVQQLDAQVAVDRLKPKVVIAAWVTHKYSEKEHWRGGNMWGVDEGKLVKKVEEYIHIGNRQVHQPKPINSQPHEEYEFPWLVSRAMNGSANYIAVWRK